VIAGKIMPIIYLLVSPLENASIGQFLELRRDGVGLLLIHHSVHCKSGTDDCATVTE